MKIVLIGEYSRLHNSLKEGLLKNGHQVTLIGHGDLFKKYPVDIHIDGTIIKNNTVLQKIRALVYRLSRIDIASIETYLKCMFYQKHLKGNDIVQLINETPFNISPYIEKKLLRFIFRHNKHVFLLGCGDDYTYISYSLAGKFPHSTLSPLLADPSLKKAYKNTLKYVSSSQKRIHKFIFKHIKAVIPASVEYQLAYEATYKAIPMIPNPVNVDILQPIDNPVEGKIRILHGINTSNYLKKGNAYFEEALAIIQKKYPEKVTIVTVKDLPYTTYIQQLEKAHIVLDQVYAHDQGYNALEAMAMGKVVFTGAGAFFKSYYDPKRIVAIDTIPDSQHITRALEELICNPDLITTIGWNARQFIIKEHHYISIAKQYEQTWVTYR